jgi:hypothetical protein
MINGIFASRRRLLIGSSLALLLSEFAHGEDLLGPLTPEQRNQLVLSAVARLPKGATRMRPRVREEETQGRIHKPSGPRRPPLMGSVAGQSETFFG